MIRLLLAGHGHFATGVLSGIEMIFGPQADIETVEFVDGETKSELDAKMDAALNRLADADNILLMCDVLQGSPFQSAAERAQLDNRIHVVYGTNVAMVLEVVANLMGGANDVDELKKTAVAAGKEHIGLFDPAVAVDDEDDDW